MQFAREFLAFSAITICCAIKFPCEFAFDRVNGYSCRVVNFTNVNRHAYITKVIASHLFKADNHFRNRSRESVVRVTIWNETVHYLPGNLTEEFPYLKNLHVKKCGLKALTRSTEYHGLRKMYFGFNEIDHIPVNYFWHYCKLQILSLYGNRIHDIPKTAFRDLRSLSSLSLGSNLLRDLHPKSFENCRSLEFIDLDHNFLGSIESNLFANLAKLKGIYLRNNNLISIGNGFLSTSHSNLTFALFSNNPCIKDSFNLTAVQPYNDFGHLQMLFVRDCSAPLVMTTTPVAPTTPKLLKKPKHKTQRIYFFENCTWHAPEHHRYL